MSFNYALFEHAFFMLIGELKASDFNSEPTGGEAEIAVLEGQEDAVRQPQARGFWSSIRSVLANKSSACPILHVLAGLIPILVGRASVNQTP